MDEMDSPAVLALSTLEDAGVLGRLGVVVVARQVGEQAKARGVLAQQRLVAQPADRRYRASEQPPASLPQLHLLGGDRVGRGIARG